MKVGTVGTIVIESKGNVHIVVQKDGVADWDGMKTDVTVHLGVEIVIYVFESRKKVCDP